MLTGIIANSLRVPTITESCFAYRKVLRASLVKCHGSPITRPHGYSIKVSARTQRGARVRAIGGHDPSSKDSGPV